MKTLLKIIGSVLLFFNGAGAVYGGLLMIIYPDGSALHLSADLLQYSIFNSYLIPGIILLLSNGFLSLYILIITLLNYKKFWRLIAFQGLILIGWLIAQIAMIHVMNYLQLVMFIAGLGLLTIGVLAEYFLPVETSYGHIG